MTSCLSGVRSKWRCCEHFLPGCFNLRPMWRVCHRFCFALQFKNFLGIKTTSSNRVHEQLDSVIDNIDGFQWKEFVMVRESLSLHYVALSRFISRCVTKSWGPGIGRHTYCNEQVCTANLGAWGGCCVCCIMHCTLTLCAAGHQLAHTIVRIQVHRQACQVSRHRNFPYCVLQVTLCSAAGRWPGSSFSQLLSCFERCSACKALLVTGAQMTYGDTWSVSNTQAGTKQA